MATDSSQFWDNFELELLNEQVVLFRGYLEMMEGFLETEVGNIREQATRLRRLRLEKMRQKGGQFDPTEDAPPDEAWLNSQEQMIASVFASKLRESFLISLWAFLEARLVEECRYRERWGTTKLPVAEVIQASSIIEKAKECLAGQIDFGGRELKHIKNLSLFRNFIVHAGGRFENMKHKDKKRDLENYVSLERKRERTLSLSGEGIVIHKGFCEKALDRVEAVFELLEKK